MITHIQKTLRAHCSSSPERASVYFKTAPGGYAAHDQFIGVPVPTLRTLAKEFYDISLNHIQELLESRINEERLLALIILVQQFKQKDQQQTIYDFYLDHRQHVNNWNLVDSSAHLILGAYVMDKDRTVLLDLVASENLWDRRIAIVATWYFIKKNDLTWTFKLAELLLNDQHDLMHKATGWMLREAGKKDVGQLVSFLNQHAHKMPRTMLRYAIEKFPEQQRKEYLNKRI